ncbi:MAG: TIGR03936 family radical SAM-associated protein [Armatimonadota bacterium]
MQPPTRHFAVIAFRKAGRMRFLSHLDLAAVIERAVRRADLPVKYSEGYNPSPQIGYASALPVGTAGERELAQIELERPVPADEILRRLSQQLPPELAVVEADTVSGQKKRHVSGRERAQYLVELEPQTVDAELLQRAAAQIMNAGTLVIVRETKSRIREIDIRPGIFELDVLEPGTDRAGPRLRMTLALTQQSLVKPSEVLEVIERALADFTGREHALQVRQITRLGIS